METTEELQDREMCYKKMSSGYNITITLMKSLQLWFPAQDWHKIGSVSISQWVEEGLMSFHNTLRYCCRLTVAEGRGAIFFSDEPTGKLPFISK